jgi:hypothetical protein
MEIENRRSGEYLDVIEYLGLQDLLGMPDDPDRADQLTAAGNSPSVVQEIRRKRMFDVIKNRRNASGSGRDAKRT